MRDPKHLLLACATGDGMGPTPSASVFSPPCPARSHLPRHDRHLLSKWGIVILQVQVLTRVGGRIIGEERVQVLRTSKAVLVWLCGFKDSREGTFLDSSTGSQSTNKWGRPFPAPQKPESSFSAGKLAPEVEGRPSLGLAYPTATQTVMGALPQKAALGGLSSTSPTRGPTISSPFANLV